jgi:signal transduction histidine kinase
MVTHSKESIKTADQLEQLIKDVRQLSHDLAPPLAHVSGLIPLIEKLITETRLATGLEVKFQQHNYKEVLASNQIQQVYRIIQEALNNIVKHAQATRVDVQIFGHEGEVNISIEDNGIGFYPSEVPDGMGLNQMKIRTESLGGRIEINSHPGNGTLLLISVPVH